MAEALTPPCRLPRSRPLSRRLASAAFALWLRLSSRDFLFNLAPAGALTVDPDRRDLDAWAARCRLVGPGLDPDIALRADLASARRQAPT
jgi:hypothetical protein